MAHCLVQLLAARDTEIHLLAPPATAPVAERMAEVARVHVVDFAHGELALAKRRAVGHSLRGLSFRSAYVLPNSWKSALVPWFANIPSRTGWQGEARFGLLNDRRRLDKARYPLMIERFMALADPHGDLPEPYPQPRLDADSDNAKRLIRELELSISGPIAVLCPGAEFGAAKKWPARHYGALARKLLDAGSAVWLMGSPNDRIDAELIEEQAPGAVNLAGRTSLQDAIDLLALADQVVCNDSGLMHIACALQVPTLGIFGSTSPGFTPPLGTRAQVVERTLDCRPCFERNCPLGHLDCLNKLEPATVIAKLAERPVEPL